MIVECRKQLLEHAALGGIPGRRQASLQESLDVAERRLPLLEGCVVRVEAVMRLGTTNRLELTRGFEHALHARREHGLRPVVVAHGPELQEAEAQHGQGKHHRDTESEIDAGPNLQSPKRHDELRT